MLRKVPLIKRQKDHDRKATSEKWRNGTGTETCQYRGARKFMTNHTQIFAEKRTKLYLEEVCDFLLLGEIFSS